VSGADIAALATGISGIIAAITALVVAVGHVLHHDAPAGDAHSGSGDSPAPR